MRAIWENNNEQSNPSRSKSAPQSKDDPLFKFRDLNNDGKISKSEEKELLKIYDTNKDGKVTDKEIINKAKNVIENNKNTTFKTNG